MAKPNLSGSAVQRAGHWLRVSGIQHPGPDKHLQGGVSAWYELDEKIYPFLYSEITGYALSAFIFLKRVYGGKEWIWCAKKAADWLMGNAYRPDGGVKTRYYLVKHYVSPNYSFHQGRVYAFDAAMVGYGFLQLYRETQKPEHLRAAESTIDFLIQRMRQKNGTFSPFLDAGKNHLREDLSKWSDQAGSFHAKLALLFIDHYRLTQNSQTHQAALDLLNATLRMQEKNGRFITAKGDGSTHLHPHAYTLEGLLYGTVHLNKKSYFKACLKGFCWMLKGVSSDGSVSSIYSGGSFSHHERSDIVAQTLRMGSALYALAPREMKPHLSTLEKIKRNLLYFQCGGNSKQSGGFIYGAATDGLLRVHLNAWATMFGLQALWMHWYFVEKKKPLNLDAFI